jgi:hypothetical protein
MEQTIESKVAGRHSGIGRFFSKALLYIGALGAAGGLGAIGQQAYYDINGLKPVVMRVEEYERFSNAVRYYDALCNQAKQLREHYDKNRDGILSREEVGLPPK